MVFRRSSCLAALLRGDGGGDGSRVLAGGGGFRAN